jgi:hypothetical protein
VATVAKLLLQVVPPVMAPSIIDSRVVLEDSSKVTITSPAVSTASDG